MKKRVFVVLILVVVVLACFAGCTHKHSYSSKWSHDETKHFHSATCGHDVFVDEEEHTFGEEKIVASATCTENGKKEKECSVCGYKKEETIPAAHTYQIEYDYVYHFKKCTVCGDTLEKEAHNGNPCTICGNNVVYSALEMEENGENAYKVTGLGDCTDSILNIPATYDGKPVTAIDGFAFMSQKFTQVNIPCSVTSIGIAAFMYCSALEKINIPDSVTSLGGNAFNGCSALNEIDLPDSITEIGGFCFKDSGIYNNAEKWTDNVLYIGNYAIKGDEEKFSGALNIKEGTLAVATYAFSGCKHMTEVNISKSVKHIGVGAFSECLDTTSMTVNADNEIYYSEGNCIIEKETKKLVAGCPTSVIPKDIKIIGESSFSSLEITEVTIPISVESIETFAFGYCDKLEDFNYDGTIDQWKEIKLGTGWKSDMVFWVIHCTDGFINEFGETRR